MALRLDTRLRTAKTRAVGREIGKLSARLLQKPNGSQKKLKCSQKEAEVQPEAGRSGSAERIHVSHVRSGKQAANEEQNQHKQRFLPAGKHLVSSARSIAGIPSRQPVKQLAAL